MLPILAVAVLELALRLGGYGFPTTFFLPLRIGDQPFLVENAAFGYRFFPREMAREPLELRLPVRKAEGTYRIFILGESAAMGDPEPAFGAGRYLEILLRERFPQTKFEVVNTAMTAINSHAILPIARECTGHEGDLWILYIGNNEMVGPFGAASAFGRKAPPLPLIRLYLAAQKTRVGQLALDLKRKLKLGAPAETWAGMKMFIGNEVAPDAPARESVYRNFAQNLSDIVQAGLGSGAKVILSTVAVNLKDSPPFASLHSGNVSAADRAGCDTNFQAGLLAAQRDQPAEAAQDFERAAKCDPGMAEVQYQWGEVLLKLADPNAAGHFQKACDTDALPFRATAQINELIKSVGRRFAGPGLESFDAVATLQTNAPAGLCGQETFYEHVHFNFDGNYRLARAWAGEVEKFLPAACRRGERSEWSSQTRCEELLGLNDWDRYNVATELVRRRQVPPLSSLPNNGPLLKALTDDAARLKREMETSTNLSQTRELYTAALRESPEDFYLHSDFAEFLTDTGKPRPPSNNGKRSGDFTRKRTRRTTSWVASRSTNGGTTRRRSSWKKPSPCGRALPRAGLIWVQFMPRPPISTWRSARLIKPNILIRRTRITAFTADLPGRCSAGKPKPSPNTVRRCGSTRAIGRRISKWADCWVRWETMPKRRPNLNLPSASIQAFPSRTSTSAWPSPSWATWMARRNNSRKPCASPRKIPAPRIASRKSGT